MGGKEKVDLSFDLITSNGDKLALTIAAEAQARVGHDVMTFQPWYAAAHADKLVPVDDLVQEQIAKFGEPAPGCAYLGKIDGHWAGVRPPTAAAPCRPAPASICSRNTPGST